MSKPSSLKFSQDLVHSHAQLGGVLQFSESSSLPTSFDVLIATYPLPGSTAFNDIFSSSGLEVRGLSEEEDPLQCVFQEVEITESYLAIPTSLGESVSAPILGMSHR
jgi:hypothetical protein